MVQVCSLFICLFAYFLHREWLVFVFDLQSINHAQCITNLHSFTLMSGLLKFVGPSVYKREPGGEKRAWRRKDSLEEKRQPGTHLVHTSLKLLTHIPSYLRMPEIFCSAL